VPKRYNFKIRVGWHTITKGERANIETSNPEPSSGILCEQRRHAWEGAELATNMRRWCLRKCSLSSERIRINRHIAQGIHCEKKWTKAVFKYYVSKKWRPTRTCFGSRKITGCRYQKEKKEKKSKKKKQKTLRVEVKGGGGAQSNGRSISGVGRDSRGRAGRNRNWNERTTRSVGGTIENGEGWNSSSLGITNNW